jgi:hypothetical protein
LGAACIIQYKCSGNDPWTGAMFNLTPERIEQPLTTAQADVIRNGEGVLVVLASQTTEHERAQTFRVN